MEVGDAPGKPSTTENPVTAGLPAAEGRPEISCMLASAGKPTTWMPGMARTCIHVNDCCNISNLRDHK